MVHFMISFQNTDSKQQHLLINQTNKQTNLHRLLQCIEFEIVDYCIDPSGFSNTSRAEDEYVDDFPFIVVRHVPIQFTNYPVRIVTHSDYKCLKKPQIPKAVKFIHHHLWKNTPHTTYDQTVCVYPINIPSSLFQFF